MNIEGTPEQQAELFSALVEARKKFGDVKKDKEGQEGAGKYQYAPLCNLVEATAHALAEQGLIVLQPFSVDGVQGIGTLTTILLHKSGGRITDVCVFPLADNIKLIGGQSTYMARYAYQRLLVLDGEDDADNHSARPQRQAKRPATDEQDERIKMLGGELGLALNDLNVMCREVTGVNSADVGYDECAKLIAHLAKLMNEKVKSKAGVKA